jgi:hypothetical protein
MAVIGQLKQQTCACCGASWVSEEVASIPYWAFWVCAFRDCLFLF